MKKKAKLKRQKKHTNGGLNTHHILWQRRFWDYGWSKRLREHPYMQKLVPKDTLHLEIHNTIANIPTPNEAFCKIAFYGIKEKIGRGEIDLIKDTICQRIDTLLAIWDGYDELEETIEALKRQRKVVSRFEGGKY